MNHAIGIIGTGHLASYTVAGLRKAGDSSDIFLSPRNATIARKLAGQYGCRIARANQEVVDRSETILLAVRPDSVNDALQGCKFSARHLVVSCVAGLPLQSLAAVRPAAVVRAMPLSGAEYGVGAIPVYPPNKTAHALLSQIGKVVELDNETQFEQATVIACYSGWLLELFDSMTAWLTRQDFAPETARDLIAEAARGAAELARQKKEISLMTILDGIATEGTLTRTGLDTLRAEGAFRHWPAAADRLMSILAARPD
ncbi:MAG TPA: NAD(P)-binding domain-containing protein [Desulfuromonadales bacterium]|nr:NAD(P)-binding domain-containing protein [Desulfuromonadales bacterium]